MTPDAIIQKAFLVAQGKAVPPATGTTKYTILLSIVDSMQKMWYNEPSVDYWDSRYVKRTLTATAAASTTIALDADILKVVSLEDDPILIGGNPFQLVRPSQLYKYRSSDVCAKIGSTLKFSRTLDTTLVGAAVQVPAVIDVPDITSADGADATKVVVDDPMWLAYASAAQFARNNIVKSAEYDHILQLAQQSMENMIANNAGAIEEVGTPWTPEGESWV